MTWIDVGANIAAERNSVAAANQLGIPALTVRSDADTSYVQDGDLGMLQVDEEGRLKISSKPPSYPVSTATVNTLNATLPVNTSRASNVMVHVRNDSATSHAAGQYTFEGSLDSTNGTDGKWFVVQAIRTNANTIETTTGTLTITGNTGLAYGWEASVNGLEWFRVRCSLAATAGSVPVWTVRRGSYATEPIPGAQVSGTQAVSGTVTANIGFPSPTNYNVTTAATTNAAIVKATAGSLYEITVSNPTATPLFVKFYNKATAPTVGTDVPLFTLPCPATSLTDIQFPPTGKRFTTGIGICATANMIHTDTAVAVAGVQVNASYI